MLRCWPVSKEGVQSVDFLVEGLFERDSSSRELARSVRKRYRSNRGYPFTLLNLFNAATGATMKGNVAKWSDDSAVSRAALTAVGAKIADLRRRLTDYLEKEVPRKYDYEPLVKAFTWGTFDHRATQTRVKSALFKSDDNNVFRVPKWECVHEDIDASGDSDEQLVLMALKREHKEGQPYPVRMTQCYESLLVPASLERRFSQRRRDRRRYG